MSPRIRDWSDPSDPHGHEPRLPTVARLYTQGLRALAQRELTAQQLRDRLLAAGGRAADVEDVVARLRAEGALDERRAARVYAHTAFRQRKRARSRILLELEQLGVPRDVARDAVDEVCGPEIERHRLDQAVIQGLRGTRRDQRSHDARRLFAALVRQGFDPDDIKRALARAGVDDTFSDD